MVKLRFREDLVHFYLNTRPVFLTVHLLNSFQIISWWYSSLREKEVSRPTGPTKHAMFVLQPQVSLGHSTIDSWRCTCASWKRRKSNRSIKIYTWRAILACFQRAFWVVFWNCQLPQAGDGGIYSNSAAHTWLWQCDSLICRANSWLWVLYSCLLSWKDFHLPKRQPKVFHMLIYLGTTSK